MSKSLREAGRADQERFKKLTATRAVNHKVRSLWFQSRASWPQREASISTLVQERARARFELEPVLSEAEWELAGPTNVGGRMTSIVVHPADPDLLWAGAAGGGVWRSRDAGRTWEALWHLQPTLNIGSLALDPSNPDILYCGTGEANFSADSYAGVGLYRSTNSGDSWLPLAPADLAELPGRIGALAIDPSDPSHLRLGGIGFNAGEPSGMYVSRDGGVTWMRELFVGEGTHWCNAIVFDPQDPRTIYSSFTARGAQSGIWRSDDGGGTWLHLTDGLPDPARMGRTMLAVSPSDPSVVYAQAAVASSRMGTHLGVFRSSDRGETWKRVGAGHFLEERQMSYNNAVAVHPEDPDLVVCAGVDVHRSRDGGETWEQVTVWHARRGEPNYSHADHHALLWAGADRLYAMNDGGMDVSDDRGATWQNRSSGLSVTMFYDLDVCQANPEIFGGGCQDNGTNITVDGDPGGFFDITGGDGGWLVLDPGDPNHVIASIYNLNIFRFRASSGWTDISPPADDAEKGSVWMCFIAMEPASPKTLYTGSSRVWKTTDDGASWKAVSEPLDGSPITAIAIAPSDPRRVYVATENGAFFRSEDAGSTWSPNLEDMLPGFTITRLAVHPEDPEIVLATVGNFGHSHVYRTFVGGDAWEDADGGFLPDVPHHTLLIDPDSPDTVFVGGDAGVFVSADLGETWEDLSLNLPSSPVVDLVLHQAGRTLTAATYGRSLWKLSLEGLDFTGEEPDDGDGDGDGDGEHCGEEE